MPALPFMPLPEDLAALQADQLAGQGIMPGLDYQTADVAALMGGAAPQDPSMQEQPQNEQPILTANGTFIPPGTKHSSGVDVSVSHEGLTPEGKNIVRAGSDLKGRTAAEVGRFNNENNYWTGQYNDAAQQQVNALGEQSDAAVAANEAAAGDTQQSQNAAMRAARAYGVDPNSIQGSGEALRAVAEEQVLNQEIQAANAMKADMAQSRANFEGALARQEAMQIDPHRLFRNSAIQWSGAIAAVSAVSNKPGNQALANTLMGTINNAVRNDIDGQIANLNNQKSVTDGFAQAWRMAAADSLTETEARHKIGAMYLGTIESHINALAMKEQSKVIRASYMKMAAQVNAEKVKLASDAYTERAKIHEQRLGTISQDWRTAASLNVERAKIALGQRELDQKALEHQDAQKALKKADEDKAAAKKAAIQADATFSTSKDGGNRYLGQISGVNDTEKAKNKAIVNQIQADSSTAAENLSRIMDLNRQIREANGKGLAQSVIVGMQDELRQQLQTLKNVTAPVLASSLHMTPISDTDITKMEKAIGTDKAQELLANALGIADYSSEKATAQVIDLISRRADDTIRNYVVPAGNQEEIDAVREKFGDATMFEKGGAFVPIPKVGKDGGLYLETTAIPVADEEGNATKKAIGFEAMGDITKYQPNSMPGRKEEANATLNPKQQTVVDRLRKGASEYTPGKDAKLQPKESTLGAWREYANSMDKSGSSFEDGTKFLGRYGDKGESYNVPPWADEVTELGFIAWNPDVDPDLKAVAVDVLTAMKTAKNDQSDYAEWVLDNEVTRDRAGKLISDETKRKYGK